MRIGISGVRGIAGLELGPTQVLEMCNSFAAMCKSNRCAIGTDTRDSGPMLSRAAIASLEQNGIDVLDFGVVPTPVIFRESRKIGAGIIITASHNPLEWNGLKFVLDGRGVDASTIPPAPDGGARHGHVGAYTTAYSTYVDDAAALVGKVHAQTSVALDAGGGAALETAKKLLEAINCTVKTVDSARGPDPTDDALEELAEESRNCDIGLGFDLDGDRVVVARNGKIQSSDATLAIGVRWALDRGYSRFALSQDTSTVIEKMITTSHASVIQSAVGELNVLDAIDRIKCNAGGEGSSAGFILPEFNYCRDGILTGAIASIMSSSGKLDDILGKMSGHLIRQKVAARADAHRHIIEHVAATMQNEFVQTNRLDGFYGIADDSTWVLVRGSNTEDSVRVSVESSSIERAQSLARRVSDTVTEYNDA